MNLLLLISLAVSMAMGNDAKTSKRPRIDGLSALKVIDTKTIEINRDRTDLLGIQGLEKERVIEGKSFVLEDADHISLEYKLIKIEDQKIILEETDRSHLSTQERRNRVTTIELRPFGGQAEVQAQPIITKNQAKKIALKRAVSDPNGMFKKPYIQSTEKQVGSGNWVVKLLSEKPDPLRLGEMYMYVIIDKGTGKIISVDVGGGS